MDRFVSLKKSADYGRAYRQGRSYGNSLLVMYIFERGRDQEDRVGISVSKKVGNSVIRHLVKRRIREAVRTHPHGWKDGCDIVIVARPAARSSNYQELLGAVLSAGTHLNVYSDHSHI